MRLRASFRRLIKPKRHRPARGRAVLGGVRAAFRTQAHPRESDGMGHKSVPITHRAFCYFFPPRNRTVRSTYPKAQLTAPQVTAKLTVIDLPPANFPLCGTTSAAHAWDAPSQVPESKKPPLPKMVNNRPTFWRASTEVEMKSP